MAITSIHQSSLNMALRCGEQFRRRYVEEQIVPPGVAAGRGTGVHKANEANLKQKIITEVDLPADDLKDAARDGFVHAFRHGVYMTDEDAPHKERILNDALNETMTLTDLYREAVAPGIQPLDVERKFDIDIGLPLNLRGMIDIQRKAKLDDLKTSSKTWAANQIEKEIQPIMYSMVHEIETGIRPRFDYHILIALKTKAKHQVQSITPTKAHYRALVAKLNAFCKMVETGTFLPANPTSWWCSVKWCGYFKTCPYVGNPYPSTWI